ncbi:MAG: hypothetical protein ACKE51_04050 [Methylococcaceae bacterium]
MKKSNKAPLAITIGSTLLTGLGSPALQADPSAALGDNPFTLTELSTGYMQTAESDSESNGSKKMKDGSCGEGNCGSKMMKGSEEKTSEGKCAGNKPMPKATKSDKDMEGKCGEGKCGSSM